MRRKTKKTEKIAQLCIDKLIEQHEKISQG